MEAQYYAMIVAGLGIGYVATKSHLRFKGRKKREKEIEDMIYNIVPIHYADPERKMLLDMHNEIREQWNKDKIALMTDEEIENFIPCKPLIADQFTTILAGNRAKEMIRFKKLSHEEAADEIGSMVVIGADTVGENIAFGHGTIKGLMKMWRESPGHYPNIVNPDYDWCGIAIMKDENGRPWYVILFGNEKDLI